MYFAEKLKRGNCDNNCFLTQLNTNELAKLGRCASRVEKVWAQLPPDLGIIAKTPPTQLALGHTFQKYMTSHGLHALHEGPETPTSASVSHRPTNL